MFICAVGQLAPITKFEHMQLKINHKRRSCALLCSCTSVLVHLCTCADVRLCICLIVLLCSCAGITMGRTDLPAPVSPYLEEAEYVVVLRREATSTMWVLWEVTSTMWEASTSWVSLPTSSGQQAHCQGATIPNDQRQLGQCESCERQLA